MDTLPYHARVQFIQCCSLPYSQTTIYLLTSSIIISPGLVNYVLVIICIELFNVVIALNYCMVQVLGMLTHFSSWTNRAPFPSILPLYRPVLLFCTLFTERKYYIKNRKSVCTIKNYTVKKNKKKELHSQFEAAVETLGSARFTLIQLLVTSMSLVSNQMHLVQYLLSSWS